MRATIHTESLCKSYGKVEAIRDVNIEVHKAEVFGYLGPNGAGKTTTIRTRRCVRHPSGRCGFYL